MKRTRAVLFVRMNAHVFRSPPRNSQLVLVAVRKRCLYIPQGHRVFYRNFFHVDGLILRSYSLRPRHAPAATATFTLLLCGYAFFVFKSL